MRDPGECRLPLERVLDVLRAMRELMALLRATPDQGAAFAHAPAGLSGTRTLLALKGALGSLPPHVLLTRYRRR